MTLEMDTQRRLTKAFIDTMPVTLTLTPRIQVKTPAGGTKWQEGDPRDPQVLRLIEQATVGGDPHPIVTVDGVERKVEFELLGEYTSLIARGDVFLHSGKEWEVIDLWIDNGWEKRALVSARG